MAASSEVTRAAGLIVFRRVGNYAEFLLLQCRKKKHWTPPKGRVDSGEDEWNAALRETEEEAGLRKEDMKMLDGFKHVLKYRAWGREKTVVYWLAELVNSEAEVQLSHEHCAFQWCALEKAEELIRRFPSQLQMLVQAASFLAESAS